MTEQVARQTVNQANFHTGPALFVSLCGAHFNGLQERMGGKESLVVFTDPITQDTSALPISEATIGNIWRKLQGKRKERHQAIKDGVAKMGACPCGLAQCKGR